MFHVKQNLFHVSKALCRAAQNVGRTRPIPQDGRAVLEEAAEADTCAGDEDLRVFEGVLRHVRLSLACLFHVIVSLFHVK